VRNPLLRSLLKRLERGRLAWLCCRYVVSLTFTLLSLLTGCVHESQGFFLGHKENPLRAYENVRTLLEQAHKEAKVEKQRQQLIKRQREEEEEEEMERVQKKREEREKNQRQREEKDSGSTNG